MKKGEAIVVFSVMILFGLISIVIAIPNPAPVYCTEMGYTANDTHCIFDNNNSCELWKFYNKECGSDYVKNLSCAKQGESLLPGHICCEGLVSIGIKAGDGENGICSALTGSWSICSPCGNSVCDSTTESYCNCPEDCPRESMNNSENKNEDESETTNNKTENNNENGGIMKIRNRIMFSPFQKRNESECLLGCSCHGAVMSCLTATGKTITIQAGRSGNTFVITIDKINTTAEVELVFENVTNKTILRARLKNGTEQEVKIMPEVAREMALEKLKLKLCNETNNCTIVLKEVSVVAGDKVPYLRLAYEIRAVREGRFLWFFKTKKQVMLRVDVDGGDEIK